MKVLSKEEVELVSGGCILFGLLRTHPSAAHCPPITQAPAPITAPAPLPSTGSGEPKNPVCGC